MSDIIQEDYSDDNFAQENSFIEESIVDESNNLQTGASATN
jgi:hypothetical protein